MNTGDLTSPSYWETRQRKLRIPEDRGPLKDLLDSVCPYLAEYRSQKWIELGCSPGHVSYLLSGRIPFVPFGVDFSPQAHLYTDIMSQRPGAQPTLFQVDLRNHVPPEPYDVTMSFGLVEHFEDPREILEHHYRLCRVGGLIVVTIPHFRQLQWLYHYWFDRTDLKKHNVSMMDLNTFRVFAQEKGLDLCFLEYVGKMNFWNVDETGPRVRAIVRKGLSIGTRAISNHLLSRLLPTNKKLYAPWIVFVARKT